MKNVLFSYLIAGFTLCLVALACSPAPAPSPTPVPVPAFSNRQEIWFHPMTAHADKAGNVSTKLVAYNDDTDGAGLIIKATASVSDNDLEWVNVDLPLPVLNADGKNWQIDSIEVCYDVKSATPGSTFISQIRLAEMTTPNSATVRHDDANNQSSATPVCYKADVANVRINGAYELALRIAIGNTGDRIRIGGIRVFLKS